MKFRRFICALFLLSTFAPSLRAQRTLPTPAWKPGYIAFYRIHLKTDRNIKAKSSLSLPNAPNEAKIDVSGVLHVEVLAANPNEAPSGMRFRTHFLYLLSDIGALQRGKKPDQSETERTSPDDKYVDCLLQADGQIAQISGLDALAPEQQDAWREWAQHFSAAFLIETEAHKRGAKWNSEQLETSPSPIADLRWQKKSQYVHDEPCAPVKLNSTGQPQRGSDRESCAVILTTASLVQKSSQQDATPQDYKLRGLHTRGTAKGENETILYISRRSGQLIRATQDAKQQMNVQISLADGSSQVHYAVTASANSTVELVTELPFNPHPNQKP
jgi:hypothetical protein